MKRFIAALRNPSFWPWLIIVPGVILRLWGLTSSPIWYDEAFTRMVASLPTDRLLQATAGDVHPPFYYMLLGGVVALFGDSLFSIRMFSVVCSVLALKDFWSLTGELPMSRAARLVALAIMAYNPVTIYYAQEARMYALLQLLVISQVLHLLRREWFFLGVYTLMALYTHNYALLYTGLIGIWGLARELRLYPFVYAMGKFRAPWVFLAKYLHRWLWWQLRRSNQARALLTSITVPVVLWLPWLSVLRGQMVTVEDHYWIQPLTAGGALAAVMQIVGGFHIPDPLLPWAVFTITARLTLLVIVGFQRRKLALLLLAFGPLAIALVVSIAWHPMLLFRGLIGSLPALALLAGDALAAANRRGRAVGLVMLAPLACALVWQIGANQLGVVKAVPWYQQPPQQTSLPIIHMDDTTLILSQNPETNYLLDAGCAPEGGTLTPQTRAALGFTTIALSDLPERYMLAGMLTPLSNACREDTYHRLIETAAPLYRVKEPLGEYGVWLHE